MAAQIPIVATTSTPGIARNSKKRPASPSHNGSSAGGYSASKKKKVSASGFAQLGFNYQDFSIDAPPSFKPAKKYSDVSGLLANYTDPQSKLRFSTIEEFSYIRRLPSDVVTGYLALRKATSIVP
ncbi:INO80 complex subunit C [Camelus dromedarius]|uniref:INO80 complex subunit C n=1 Tax=Camelus dromedarius TaxID=9838 RepID=A0A5N4CHI5_CAMDR|nr:INO80 complex subunit C [Camelus dromedarius]